VSQARGSTSSLPRHGQEEKCGRDEPTRLPVPVAAAEASETAEGLTATDREDDGHRRDTDQDGTGHFTFLSRQPG
jgi:hypothetical protein